LANYNINVSVITIETNSSELLTFVSTRSFTDIHNQQRHKGMELHFSDVLDDQRGGMRAKVTVLVFPDE